MITIAEVADISMPGTSGGLYAIFFAGLAKGLREAASELQTDEADAKVWARGLEVSSSFPSKTHVAYFLPRAARTQ